jgi:putative SOS response-associated peptidase YedK
LPWFIRSADGAPVLFGAITAWRHGAKPNAGHGITIVTDDTAGGMVDIHDRQPMALTLGEAQGNTEERTQPY